MNEEKQDTARPQGEAATEPRTEATRLREEAELLEQMRHDPKVSVRKYAARACGADWEAFARVLREAEAAQGAAPRPTQDADRASDHTTDANASRPSASSRSTTTEPEVRSGNIASQSYPYGTGNREVVPHSCSDHPPCEGCVVGMRCDLHDEGAAPRAEGLLCEGYCGDIAWTVERYGYPTHKHACPRRNRCQSHPDGCEAAPRAEGLDEAIRAVTDYSWGLHLAGTPNEAEAIALIENLRRLSRPSDEEETQRVQETKEWCARFRHDEHCAHLHDPGRLLTSEEAGER